MRWRRFLSISYVALCLNSVMAQTSEPVVSVVFAGDIMLEGGADRAIRRGRDPFAGVAHLFKGADIRLGNLECVVATVGSVEPEKPNLFRVHPRGLKYVQRHFDAVGLANNHSGDYGPQAFAQMLGLLKQSGLGYYGGGYNLKEAHTPSCWSAKGCALRFWAMTSFSHATLRLTTTDRVWLGVKTSRWCVTSSMPGVSGRPMW